MPVTRERKDELVEALEKNLKDAQAVIITDYRGLPTAELAGLRNQLRGMKASYHVTKNTLVALALKNAGLPVPEKLLDGPTAVAFLRGDIAGPAKAVHTFFTEKGLPVKGAIIGKQVYDAKGVEELAKLPGVNELRGQVIGALQGPASSLVSVLSAALSEFTRTLQARADQLGGAAS